eukprot:15167662-Alexandrium_andersonii.AAC.1
MPPPGKTVADVAVERCVWRAAVARAEAERAELLALGLVAKAAHWAAVLTARTADRGRALQARRLAFMDARDAQERQRSADWDEGDRLLAMLGVTAVRVHEGGAFIDIDEY